jgi:radical SAM superfamily enzyme YgiQ (UPF0313 family)
MMGHMTNDLSQLGAFEICSIRPPTENYSLTFRLTRNCYFNRCKFCPVYKLGARFSKRTIEDIEADIDSAKRIDDALSDPGLRNRGELLSSIQEEDQPVPEVPGDLDPRLAWFLTWFKEHPTLSDSLSHILTFRAAGGKTCFLGDSDSLILKPDFLKRVLDKITKNFPTIQRFTVYGRTSAAARLRKLDELRAFREAGLHRIHFGLESGSDTVLKFMSKGVTSREHVEGALKTKEAGLSCSVYVMPGLGGEKWSREHARQTAEVLSQIAPDYVRLRTLEVFPMTPLDQAMKDGEFSEASEEQVVEEVRTLVAETRSPTEIVSDSASNLLDVNGRLPKDREFMLALIDDYLSLSPRDKLYFSLTARLRSFIGQYGGVTADIAGMLAPFVTGNQLELESASDGQLTDITRLIRSKLMP